MFDAKNMPHARLLSLPLALAVAASASVPAALLAPTSVRANSISELTQRIEESGAAYDEAAKNIEELQAEIEENEDRIAKLEAEMPAKKQAAFESIRMSYKLQQAGGGLIEFLLSAEDFNDVIYNARYLETISAKNNEAVQELVSATSELDRARSALASERAQADSEAKVAKDALSEAIAARQKLIEEQQGKAAEETAAESADAAATDAAADETATLTTQSGTEAKVEVPSTDAISAVTTTDAGLADAESEFVNMWQPRIDAYLAGSPLAGYGKTFAEAAWTYGTDPRLSPAISCVESSKGVVCSKSHNAWGWGSSSWSDWDSAIRDHVKGLATTYGGQLTVGGAQMYCPTTWQDWYSSVLSEMNSI
ncbi:hypothetical protein [Paratractidigestivibacter sp.]|uniref:hypothetical protein n=1 Tax=Paratractidigestivibacter sp. TaxID=2847316 RepID=UPI002ABD970C|nr:hypothetical protein [Paratractidigestivibacter sp.]